MTFDRFEIDELHYHFNFSQPSNFNAKIPIFQVPPQIISMANNLSQFLYTKLPQFLGFDLMFKYNIYILFLWKFILHFLGGTLFFCVWQKRVIFHILYSSKKMAGRWVKPEVINFHFFKRQSIDLFLLYR